MSQCQQGLRKFLDPFSDGFLWIAAVEMPTPWIGVIPRTILQFDLLRATNELCGRAGNHGIWIDVLVHRTVGTYQCTFSDGNTGQYDRHGGDHSEVFDRYAGHHFTRWVRVVGQYHVGEDPDVVAYRRVLSNVNIAMAFDIVSNLAMALDIAQSANLETVSGCCQFSYSDSMACTSFSPKVEPS